MSALTKNKAVSEDFAGENLAMIRHLALNLLKQEPTANCGITATAENVIHIAMLKKTLANCV